MYEDLIKRLENADATLRSHGYSPDGPCRQAIIEATAEFRKLKVEAKRQKADGDDRQTAR